MNMGDNDGAGAPKEPVTISYGEFRSLISRVVVHLRRLETVGPAGAPPANPSATADASADGGVSAPPPPPAAGRGLASRAQLVRLLVGDAERPDGGGLLSEAELAAEVRRMRMVIHRMVAKERVLVEIPNQDPGLAKKDRLLGVHPNYSLDE